MDFEALRARADDFVTGIAADVTERVLDVVDDALTMVETAQYQAEQMKQHQTGPFQFNFDGAMSAEEVARKVKETLSRVQGQQAKPAPAKTGGTEVPSKNDLVRSIYKYLSNNHPSYMVWSSQFEDYNVESQWESDRVVLLEDLADLFTGRVEPRKQ